MIKNLLPSKGRGYKLQVKPLAKGQSLVAMVGYITKDQGKTHYKILAHNITAQVNNLPYYPNLNNLIITRRILQELTNGRREHESMRANYTENKRVLTYRNLYLEAYRFVTRALYPIIVPLNYAILSTEFVQTFKKLDEKESRTVWKIIWHPKKAKISDIMVLVFDRRSYDFKKVRNHYILHNN